MHYHPDAAKTMTFVSGFKKNIHMTGDVFLLFIKKLFISLQSGAKQQAELL